MLANSHTGLVNLHVRAPTRTSNLHRGLDPGTGASTTYHDIYFDASQDLEVGAELFVEYGNEWFSDREQLGLIPLSYDFKIADRTVDFLSDWIGNSSMDFVDHQQAFVEDFFALASNITSRRPRLVNAFPKDLLSFQRAAQDGTASLTVPNRIRSIQWLEQNGRCLDNIRPDLSTIRQAGRGAFATRRIKKGAVITPMPLVHVRRHHMEVFGSDDYEDENADIWREGAQLLLNYCYGHPESSLLLFPYAPVSNYINHNVSGSNAELRWSSLPNHHTDWLERTPDSLDAEDHSGLIMELVAQRDIDVGEEIFLNYGSEWESRWNDFKENWKVNDYDKRYASSESLNERLEWLKTTDELDSEPYTFSNRKRVLTVCFMSKISKNQVATEPGSMKTFRWSGSKKMFYSADAAHPCEIVGRNLTNSSFDEAHDRQDSVLPVHATYSVLLQDAEVKIIDVPRKAILFFDDQYKSDNFWRKAFRHEMHLPDHMVPPAWRDLTED
jgi:SET domain